MPDIATSPTVCDGPPSPKGSVYLRFRESENFTAKQLHCAEHNFTFAKAKTSLRSNFTKKVTLAFRLG